jgi:hypothetical protein
MAPQWVNLVSGRHTQYFGYQTKSRSAAQKVGEGMALRFEFSEISKLGRARWEFRKEEDALNERANALMRQADSDLDPESPEYVHTVTAIKDNKRKPKQ